MPAKGVFESQTNDPMTNSRTLPATEVATPAPAAGAVAIPVNHLPYLRFLSVILNKPLNEVATRFLRKKR